MSCKYGVHDLTARVIAILYNMCARCRIEKMSEAMQRAKMWRSKISCEKHCSYEIDLVKRRMMRARHVSMWTGGCARDALVALVPHGTDLE